MEMRVICASAYFYPRSPCGERPVKLFRQNYECFISIHALLAESDIVILRKKDTPSQFLSTLSLRRATRQFPCQSPEKSEFLSTLSLRRATSGRPETRQPCAISIHALLAESDINSVGLIVHIGDFYPRSPCGERRL